MQRQLAGGREGLDRVALYEEPASDFQRSIAPGWGAAIVSTIGGVVLLATIPLFIPDLTVALRGFEVALLVTLFIFAELTLWSGILRRQRYRVGGDWIQPAHRPLAYALRGQGYVIHASEITNVQMGMSPYGKRLTRALLLSGKRVRLTPPLDSPEADAAVDQFLKARDLRAPGRPSVTSGTTLDAPVRLYKVTVLTSGIAWLILSGVSVYLSLWSGVPPPYALLFILSSWAVITLWLRIVRPKK